MVCVMLARMETRDTHQTQHLKLWRTLRGWLVKVEEDSSLHRLCPRLRVAHSVTWIVTVLDHPAVVMVCIMYFDYIFIISTLYICSSQASS